MCEAKADIRECEKQQRNAHPHNPVVEHHSLEMQLAPALLVCGPHVCEVFYYESNADRIEQLAERPAVKNEGCYEEAHENKQHAAHVCSHRPARTRSNRELHRR